MNILFLTSRFPFPPIGGDRLRPYHFIKELSKRHKIHLLSFVRNGEIDRVDRDIKKRIKISVVKHSHVKSCFKTALNILSDEPLQVSYYYYKAVQDKINAILKEEKIDIVFAHLIRMAKYVKALSGVKKVIDYTDSFELLYSRSYALRKGIFRLIDYVEAGRTGAFEKTCLRFFDKAIAVSNVDKKWIEKNTGCTRIKVISYGVDIPARPEAHAEGVDTIAFASNMRSFSNRYAITDFVLNTYPAIRARKKGVRLHIIGAEPPAFLKKRQLSDPSIHVTGKVSNIDTHIKKCSIGIAPMASCAGVQGKILKYMSLKIPVVATPIASGGFEAVNGRDIVVAHSREDFAKEVISLLEDKEKQKALGESGYRHVLSNHNWKKITEELERFLTE